MAPNIVNNTNAMRNLLAILLVLFGFTCLAQTEFHIGTGVGLYGQDREGFPVTFSLEPQLFIGDNFSTGLTGAYSVDESAQIALFAHYGRGSLIYGGLGLGAHTAPGVKHSGFPSYSSSSSTNVVFMIQPRVGVNLGAGFDFRVYGGFSPDAAARGGVAVNKVF